MRRGEVESGAKNALVTGGSSGIGFQFARQLASLGYNVIIVADGQEKLRTAQNQLEEAYNKVSIAAMCVDLAQEEAVEQVYEWCTHNDWQIDVLVNCAGIFSFCDLTLTPPERVEKLIAVNSAATVKLCRLFGEDMAARGQGHILNVASYSLWMPFPGLALYAASKAFVRSFSVAFAKEMRTCGVTVTVVCPAGVKTDLYGLSPKFQKLGAAVGALISPESCAKRSLRALWCGRRCIVPDWWNRMFIPLFYYMPRPVTAVIRKYTMKYQK